MTYQETFLWKRTLGLDHENVKPLRNSFFAARKNAEFLLAKIRQDFPNLTVHDISHVDSLWNVADTIIGEDYPINPLEGYILGIAFLIHDAALSYDAVGGKDKLRQTVEWKDVYADGPGSMEIGEFEKECDFSTIRALHAKYAEAILSVMFVKDNGSTFYIIDNDDYRKHYGEIIGKIAASHHWDIDDVSIKLKKQINPRSGMPRDWVVNAQKLACILRCADAGHIDDGRAPDCIYNSLMVNGVSREHWESQNHLCQVCKDTNDDEKLCITSSNPFEKKDFAAWNVAYDSIKLFDTELKKSNNLLKSISTPQIGKLEFPYRGVSGSYSKESLAQYVETKDWVPCNISIHTSNIKSLIQSLGGNKLYGYENQLLVVLRELIQNARDAIHARIKIDESYNDGKIIIRLKEDGKQRFLEIEDNGTGMSLDCIKYHLLDFGNSYWKSSLSKYEHPGLNSSGFTSIGKYGIGFYSVFMVAESIDIITRRYDKSTTDAKKVEFPQGLTLSPILSGCELSTNISTIIRFQLNDEIELSFKLGRAYEDIQLEKALQILTAGLDADVYLDYNNKIKCIHKNILAPNFNKEEWLSSLCVDDIQNSIRNLAKSLEWLKDDEGHIKGLIAISDGIEKDKLLPLVETVSGLSTSLYSYTIKKGFWGYISCKEEDLSRNNIHLDHNTAELLQSWIKNKYDENYNRIVTSYDLAKYYAKAISYCGLNPEEIVKSNQKTIYSSYKTLDIKIGTIEGLKRIHTLLFSGITELAGVYRINDVYFGSNNNSSISLIPVKQLDSALKKIDKMPDDNYDCIISKYIKIVLAHPFVDGNGRCDRIWLNLLLKVRLGYMIDWESIDRNVYYGLLQNTSKDEEPIHDYLKSYLLK